MGPSLRQQIADQQLKRLQYLDRKLGHKTTTVLDRNGRYKKVKIGELKKYRNHICKKCHIIHFSSKKKKSKRSKVSKSKKRSKKSKVNRRRSR